MLHEQIKNEIKEAMLKREQVKLDVLRFLLSAFTNELVAKKRKPNELLTDEEALAVIQRSVKQRRDSIEQFTKGGREDLAKEEKEQIVYLESYLPKMMERAEVEKFISAKKEELGVTDKTKAGLLMSAAMKDLKGKADGSLVKEVVDQLLA